MNFWSNGGIELILGTAALVYVMVRVHIDARHERVASLK